MAGNFLPKGYLGEDFAVSYLLSRGYKIIERNFYCRWGEIDIIASEGDFLVFIEVKTREEKTREKPEEAISSWKIKKLIRAAQFYKMINPQLPEALRFDFVGIVLSKGTLKYINLIKNISQ